MEEVTLEEGHEIRSESVTSLADARVGRPPPAAPLRAAPGPRARRRFAGFAKRRMWVVTWSGRASDGCGNGMRLDIAAETPSELQIWNEEVELYITVVRRQVKGIEDRSDKLSVKDIGAMFR
ncbi:hypothetical protein EVAR_50_1 [Eumeta japonica]|uniref:Uncharacterized protein n=1 Tax=Eumeta variegata TaxID=151549 RepID=A0A4C1SAE6_EUMVA|nr:hypothetical protein EVAR_50_1 [Eumeta japonica]